MIAAIDNLSQLCAEAKKPASRDAIDLCNADRTALYALLSGEAPKTRKNAARLLGALKQPRDSAALAAALTAETTLFVVPSILLALGSTGGEEARRALTAYEAPAPKDETEQKHTAAIAEALSAARALLCDAPLPKYTLFAPRRLLAVAPEGFSDILSLELTERGFSPDGCTVETADWEKLYGARCMRELLLPLDTDLPLEPVRIAAAAAGELSVPYRIELIGYKGERSAFLKQLKTALGGQNNPSHYALELRVVCKGTRCDLYLKPSYDESRRYPWRARSISASMQPSLGACLARYVAPRVHNPRVLDPFAGSGTLLFSCEEAFPCASLLGVDISPGAVAAAHENAAAGKSRARFIQKDILKFTPREKADLIISNLPFGNRVGTHENNLALYRAFLARLPELLSPGGTALLYTMEYRLLGDCLRKKGAPTLIETRRTEAGGLLPWVFVLSV